MNASDIKGLLTADEYALLAAPALKAAAEVAAERGDPDLYNDMAAMLALLAMTSALTHAYLGYQDQFPAASAPEAVEATPMAVCALVFTRTELAPIQVEDCLHALSSAYLILLKAGVLGPQEAYVEQAFNELKLGRPGPAQRLLLQATHTMVRAVDDWEARRVVASD
ncbi:MAG: hypothetical protein ACRETA_01585 [Gammaproteobacteria bacterium]